MKVAIIIIIIFIIIIITIYYHSHYYYYYYHYYYKIKLNSRGVDLIVTERINRMQIVSDDKIFLGVFAAEPLSLVGIELTDSVESNILTKAKNKSMKTLPSLFICQLTSYANFNPPLSAMFSPNVCLPSICSTNNRRCNLVLQC